MRLFVAVGFKESEIKKINAIKEKVEEKIRKNSPESKIRFLSSFHITLRFLGEIKEKDIDIIKKELEKAKPRKAELRCKKIGYFEYKKKIRILFIDIEENKNLELMQKEVYERIEKIRTKAGVKKDNKKFKAHITIARVKNDSGVREAIEEFNRENMEKIKNTVLFSQGFGVFESRLTEKGAEYSILADYSKDAV